LADDKQTTLIAKMSAHNTGQLKDFFAGSAIEGDWQLIFAASYNGCIISLPAKNGGQMRLRIAAKFRDGQPYLELRAQQMGQTGEEDDE
jgi:hypothetical protein